MPRFRYALGCRRDPEDVRDYALTRLHPDPRPRLPARLDYARRMAPVSDQGDEGTCVGFACVDAIADFKEREEHSRGVGLSVRYVFAEAKKTDGRPDEEGTSLRFAMKVLKSKGVPPEECWPYRPRQTDGPCREADELARIHRIDTYARLRSVEEMKESLCTNGPFAAGVEVFYGAWTGAEEEGRVGMPAEEEEPEGGQAVCIVGYNDRTKEFKFKNSWGVDWGARGYGFLPYLYIEKHLLDAWSARDSQR